MMSYRLSFQHWSPYAIRYAADWQYFIYHQSIRAGVLSCVCFVECWYLLCCDSFSIFSSNSSILCPRHSHTSITVCVTIVRGYPYISQRSCFSLSSSLLLLVTLLLSFYYFRFFLNFSFSKQNKLKWKFLGSKCCKLNWETTLNHLLLCADFDVKHINWCCCLICIGLLFSRLPPRLLSYCAEVPLPPPFLSCCRQSVCVLWVLLSFFLLS